MICIHIHLWKGFNEKKAIYGQKNGTWGLHQPLGSTWWVENDPRKELHTQQDGRIYIYIYLYIYILVGGLEQEFYDFP